MKYSSFYVPCCLLLLLICKNGFADFYTGTPQGWLNYNYFIPTAMQDNKPPQKPSETPSQQMQAFQAYFNNVKDEAVLDPTEQNVENYIALQNYIQNQSVHFSETWQKVLLDDPRFDYELVHPTNQNATKIDHNLQQQQEANAVAQLAQQYGMMFFYYSGDQYAQSMASSLQYFANQYGIALIGVSMDGTLIKTIANNQVNNGQAERMGVQTYPAIFLVNPKNGTFEPLAYGFISESELLDRFYNIATNFNGQNLLTGAGE